MGKVNIGDKNIQDLRKDMSLIRRMGGSVQTNYFNQCNHETKLLKCWKLEKALAFQWIDGDVKRIYFYAVDSNDLVSVLSCVEPEGVIDFVTKEKEKSADIFAKSGYRLHLEYGRFCVQPRTEQAQELYGTLHNDDLYKDIFESPYGTRAEVTDAEEIDSQLREAFDPYEAHFYSLDKLREHIAKGWVWVAKENGEILAANLFEIQGCKAYGAYLYNRGDVNVMCSLIAKTDEYVSTLGVTYSYCWMRLGNKRIIRYNMKYNGYVPDGLYNMIYVKE